uniref:MFAP1 domain-containing protein n=1 Tax=Rhabditophanes sp. KR3021 TaxID=114890 RepID=A0AC35TZE8_9BILA
MSSNIPTKAAANRLAKQLPNMAAIPVKNEKGQTVMKKVAVQRHVKGKAPALGNLSDSDSDESDGSIEEIDLDRIPERPTTSRRRDPVGNQTTTNQKAKPELNEGKESSSESEDEEVIEARRRKLRQKARNEEEDFDGQRFNGDSDLDDDEEAQRKKRENLKKEQLAKEEEKSDEGGQSTEEEESSEESSAEEDDNTIRMKPVFVPRNQRTSLLEIEKEAQAEKAAQELESQRKLAQKVQSIKLLEMTLQAEKEAAEIKKMTDALDLTEINTDDEEEDPSIAYGLWQIREIKRLKADRDEREMFAKEKEEIDKLRGLSEQERDKYFELNPKQITNAKQKGNLGFLQKYFHRGAFFLDKDEEVYQRDFTEAGPNDVVDMTLMPKVMQVKNFGKSSRSKYTHLTAEDTTDHQGTWATKSDFNSKLAIKHGGGMKNQFEKPGAKRKHQ